MNHKKTSTFFGEAYESVAFILTFWAHPYILYRYFVISTKKLGAINIIIRTVLAVLLTMTMIFGLLLFTLTRMMIDGQTLFQAILSSLPGTLIVGVVAFTQWNLVKGINEHYKETKEIRAKYLNIQNDSTISTESKIKYYCGLVTINHNEISKGRAKLNLNILNDIIPPDDLNLNSAKQNIHDFYSSIFKLEKKEKVKKIVIIRPVFASNIEKILTQTISKIKESN
jgi:hypothetical protein